MSVGGDAIIQQVANQTVNYIVGNLIGVGNTCIDVLLKHGLKAIEEKKNDHARVFFNAALSEAIILYGEKSLEVAEILALIAASYVFFATDLTSGNTTFFSNLDEASQCCDRAKNILVLHYSKEKDYPLGLILAFEGLICLENKEWEEAYALFKDASVLLEKFPERSRIFTDAVHFALGLIDLNNKKWDSSEKNFQSIIEGDASLFVVLAYLGRIVQFVGQNKISKSNIVQIVSLITETLPASRKYFGKMHSITTALSIAEILGNYEWDGNVMLAKNKLDGLFELHEKYYNCKSRGFDPKCNLFGLLAMGYLYIKDEKGGEKSLLRSLSFQEDFFGKMDPTIPPYLKRLAEFHCYQRDAISPEESPLLDKLNEERKKILTELAFVYLRRALRIQRIQLKEASKGNAEKDFFPTADTLLHLSVICNMLGKEEDAKSYQDMVFEWLDSAPVQSSGTAVTWAFEKYTPYSQQDDAYIELIFRNRLMEKEKLQGKNNLDLFCLLARLGFLYDESKTMHNPERAESYYQQALMVVGDRTDPIAIYAKGMVNIYLSSLLRERTLDTTSSPKSSASTVGIFAAQTQADDQSPPKNEHAPKIAAL